MSKIVKKTSVTKTGKNTPAIVFAKNASLYRLLDYAITEAEQQKLPMLTYILKIALLELKEQNINTKTH